MIALPLDRPCWRHGHGRMILGVLKYFLYPIVFIACEEHWSIGAAKVVGGRQGPVDKSLFLRIGLVRSVEISRSFCHVLVLNDALIENQSGFARLVLFVQRLDRLP